MCLLFVSQTMLKSIALSSPYHNLLMDDVGVILYILDLIPLSGSNFGSSLCQDEGLWVHCECCTLNSYSHEFMGSCLSLAYAKITELPRSFSSCLLLAPASCNIEDTALKTHSRCAPLVSVTWDAWTVGLCWWSWCHSQSQLKVGGAAVWK